MIRFKSFILALSIPLLTACAAQAQNDQNPWVQPSTVQHDGGYYGGAYNNGGYNGSGYGYGPIYGNGNGVFTAGNGVTCDPYRNVCYDRNGINYEATQRYYGDRDNSDLQFGRGSKGMFSPARGILCSERSRTCSDGDGVNRRWTVEVFGKKAKKNLRNWNNDVTFSPEWNVSCNNANQVCSDRRGPNVRLTSTYFGQDAARRLARALDD